MDPHLVGVSLIKESIYNDSEKSSIFCKFLKCCIALLLLLIVEIIFLIFSLIGDIKDSESVTHKLRL